MADVIREQKFPKQPGTVPYSVVLHRTDSVHHPIATHLRNDEDGSYFWGHYFEADELEGAEKDFRKRCVRAAQDCKNCDVEVPYGELQKHNIFRSDLRSSA